MTLIIKSLNPTKANWFLNISVRLIQLFGDSITPPLVQILKSSPSQGVFLDTWKMATIIPVHNTGKTFSEKLQTSKSFLPIFAKFFKDFYLILLFTIFLITIYLPNVNQI